MGEYNEDGAYVIQTGELDAAQRYKIVVKCGGETYESSFLSLQPSPEIGEIGFTEDEINGKINIWVSTKGDKTSTPYYMWTFDEDYENYAMLDMRDWNVVYSETVYPDVTETENPYFYGWTHKDSHQTMTYSTENLTENTVKEHVIKEISMDEPNLQTLYCITVYQSNLSDEAYEYYNEMKSNTEDMGTIFAPMPKEVYGNVTCTSNPDIKVRGFVSASSTTTKRLFIRPSDLKKTRCMWVSGQEIIMPKNSEYLASLFAYYLKDGCAIVSATPWALTAEDKVCTAASINVLLTGSTRYKTTKDKPDWWPNDHK